MTGPSAPAVREVGGARREVGGARDRILATAYRLFSRRGVRDVGVNEIVSASGVAKATLYQHFRTKNDLVLAFLEQREAEWTFALVEEESRVRGGTPEEQLLAIFDVFDDLFGDADRFDGCSFISILLELGPDSAAGQACIAHLATIRSIVSGRAERAGLTDPEGFARSWHILMKGSIIAAVEGDTAAARRAQRMAQLLIEDHRGEPD
ncbi:DNA-binding transcriptional regulator, AcrR family [Rhodococcus tukisamuensis]|uniref:DNA-binding transcriptional regulator, AcrR family n=1 Tax=Rhodococcus tukisamuensis TaxID=168276 RepID=A0A1G6VZ97_9NOCA|nr:DNA-binding transcriptional regulator, AcrR family [Rhodococcus tukisamuensis]